MRLALKEIHQRVVFWRPRLRGRDNCSIPAASASPSRSWSAATGRPHITTTPPPVQAGPDAAGKVVAAARQVAAPRARLEAAASVWVAPPARLVAVEERPARRARR